MNIGTALKRWLTRPPLATPTPPRAGSFATLGADVSIGMTPTRLARVLRDAEGYDPREALDLAERMEEKEPQYLAALGTRKRQIAQMRPVLEAGDDSHAAEEARAFAEVWLGRPALADEVFDVLDALGKGFSLTEIIWESSEGGWMPAQLATADPQWFVFPDLRRRDAMLRPASSEAKPRPLAPGRWLRLRLGAKTGAPTRGGLARPVAWAWLFKNLTLRGWVEFAEIYGMPLRLGKYHAGASEDDQRALLRAVASISRDAAAVVPETMSIEFAQGVSGASSDLHERLARYMDQAISKIVLGQTATTDAIAGGHAVAREHDKVRADIARSDARRLACALEQDVLAPMIRFNFGEGVAVPRLSFVAPNDLAPAALGDALAKIAPLGLRVSAGEVRARLGLRTPLAGEETLGVRNDAGGASAPLAQAGQ